MFSNGLIEFITEVVLNVFLDFLLALAGPGKEDGRRRALLSVPFGYASLHCEQGTPIPLANDLQLFNFRWQSLFKFGWQWTSSKAKYAMQ